MNGLYILLILAAYFALLLLVARLTSTRPDNDAFFRGNRRSPWPLVAFGMIGASLSGVTFVSVPGMVKSIDMTYLQTCMGFFAGYLVIAHVLLPLYYRLRLTSIYTYLGNRLGRQAYRTGASFFLLSKLLGASLRLYLVCLILQEFIFDAYGIPFAVTATTIVGLIWLYTHRCGIRTIVWTDTLQTFFLLLTLVLIVVAVASTLRLDARGLWDAVTTDTHSRVFVFDDWISKQNFFKQFFSGVFITIVMTGLDQDMMQKNLTCRNLKEARKNMYCYGFSFLPINFLFLSLGILLLLAANRLGLPVPERGDDLLPMFAAGGYLGYGVLTCFTIGILAAAFSSADSALTALTTSVCIDLLDVEKKTKEEAERRRRQVHVLLSVLFVGCILGFKFIDSPSVIDTLYTMTSYTYGPLLGLFAFGLFTRRTPRGPYVPVVAVASPVICYITARVVSLHTDYSFGYELLMLNGLLTFAGLALISIHAKKQTALWTSRTQNSK